MAAQVAEPPTTTTTAPTAQMIANAFVQQYYHILHNSPELVFRFYQDSSMISRPDSAGLMTSVTTMNQPVNASDEAIQLNSIPVSVPSIVHDPPVPDPVPTVEAGKQNAAESAPNRDLPSVNEKEAVGETGAQSHVNGKDDRTLVEIQVTSSSTQEDTPKKSYASIVKVPKGSPGPTKVYVPTNTQKRIPEKTNNQLTAPAAPAAPVPVPQEAALSNTGADPGNTTHQDVEGHSIYIRKLPSDITESQLELEFKKFGPIKQGGVQVRNNKQQGYFFGFVEFLNLSSMTDAVKASPVNIKGCQTIIEVKRANSRGNNGSGGRGRFYSGRGGYRNDNFRPRGNYGGGGRSFGRNEHANRGEFSDHGRGDFSEHGRGEFSDHGRGEFSERGRVEYSERGRGQFSDRGRGMGMGRGGEGRGRGQHSNGPKQNIVAKDNN
ncbi:hypothetical protein ACFE04_010277 [Oxalis oulophora]